MVHKVGIIGTGFVGTAVSVGFESLLKNKVQIREHDKYKPSESLETVVNSSDIIFVCLPTPMNEDGSCNVSVVSEGIQNIVKVAKKSKAIVIKSTVVPGTVESFQEKYKKHTFMFNPEFLTEKNFIVDFLEQDRIILGTPNKWEDKHNENVLKVHRLYADFANGQKKPASFYEMGLKEAEMLKYIANGFLATKVIFFNEMYEICKAAKIDFGMASGMACLDKRIGLSHSQVPGPDGQFGYGGSCLVKDLNATIAFAKEHNVDPIVLESVWTKNLLVRQEHDWEKLAQVTGEYKESE